MNKKVFFLVLIFWLFLEVLEYLLPSTSPWLSGLSFWIPIFYVAYYLLRYIYLWLKTPVTK
ncbi:hypothetical protein OZX60_06935 [Streptococcaceae bacterium ESL0687]|nr:hypothetical protein OZX60_06935 [Streptococcaceae bacterium ESL0687]